jgi:Zn-dependent peptidase ImmA (M78 family)
MVEVCQRLGEYRQRPIRLYPYAFDVPGPFGIWIKTADADIVLYQSMGTTPLHREHIIAHELGHVLADHPSDENDDVIWRELMPDIPIDTVRRALRRRTSYGSEYEREAETVATVLLEATARAHSLTLPGQSPRARRVQRTLGDPVDLL